MIALKTNVRPYRPRDIDPIFNLHNGDKSRTQLQQMFAVAARGWVLVVEDELVGYTAVWQVAGLEDLLEMDGAIHPAWRRKGLGTELLQYVIVHCRALPFATLSCPVEHLDTAVAKFLQKQQFWVEHKEWTMVWKNVSSLPPIPKTAAHLQTYPRSQAIAQFINLYEASFTGTAWNQPFSSLEVDQLLAYATDLCFLVEQNKRIGVAWLHFADEQQATIEPFGIGQEVQGQGYGRILLTTLLHHLSQQKIKTITLGVWANNHKAISLYKSVGFTHTDIVTYMACSLKKGIGD